MNPKPENRLTPAQLLETARQQRRILLLLLVSILLTLGLFAVPVAAEPGVAGLAIVLFVLLGMLALSVLSVIATFRLAKALQLPAPWVFVVCSFLPYIGMIVLLILNAQATAALKRAGIYVGLLGADRKDLERLGRTSPESTTGIDP